MKKILLLFITAIIVLAAPPKFLMPEEAFKPEAKVDNQMQIVATINIAKDIYLYEDQLKLEIKDGSGISVLKIDKPKSVEHFGDMVWLESPSFLVSLKKDADVTGTKTIEFMLSYQGCSEKGLCYEPATKTYSFEIDTSVLGVSLEKMELKVQKVLTVENAQSKKEELSESDAIADTIKSGNIFVILLC